MEKQNHKISLLLVGCGRMGAAILTGCLRADIIGSADIIDPAFPVSEFAFANSRLIRAEEISADGYDVVLLAVKPQIMGQALEPLVNVKAQSFISVAAGLKLDFFENILGKDMPVVRAMPNTPAAISKGATVCIANQNLSHRGKQLTETILSKIGTVDWIDDETMMDTITALSGSGPAYIFYLTEAMAKAGEDMGLPEQLAMRLARQTVIGSAQLMDKSPEQSASTLREQVTSPNGTTAAALSVLMDKNGLQSLMKKALNKAKERSHELSGTN